MKLLISNLPKAVEAKKAGKLIKVPDNWHSISLNIMYDLVKKKFTDNTTLRSLLLSTEGVEII